jgi:acyl-CoA thioesterase
MTGDGWLGLDVDGADASFELAPHLARSDGRLYGGTAVAVAVAAMEAVAERPVLWATVQFVSTVETGQRIRIHTEALAAGRRISQLRLTATCGGEVIFAGLGAAGTPREDVLDIRFAQMPAVAPPELVERVTSTSPDRVPGWYSVTDVVPARWVDGDPRPKRQTVWLRFRDHPLTRASLGFFADMVPASIARAAGRSGTGTSLDNTIRFGAEPRGDWVLVDAAPEIAVGGYGTGGVRLWSVDGDLLGSATQTARILLFD